MPDDLDNDGAPIPTGPTAVQDEADLLRRIERLEMAPLPGPRRRTVIHTWQAGSNGGSPE